MVQRAVDRNALVESTLNACRSGWTGCQWETEFGERKADLQGLRSRQAWLAARATRGTESEFWREVFRYLETVERDASRAAEIAAESVEIWRRGNVAEALAKLDEAIALESHYRDHSIYSQLRAVLQPTADQASR